MAISEDEAGRLYRRACQLKDERFKTRNVFEHNEKVIECIRETMPEPWRTRFVDYHKEWIRYWVTLRLLDADLESVSAPEYPLGKYTK